MAFSSFDTKTNFLKKCQEYIDTIKNCNEDEANLNFKIDSHELKFQNIEVFQGLNENLFL